MKKIESRKQLDDEIHCLICEWEGLLGDTIYSKEYYETTISYNYVCPSCGADIYHYTEDKETDAYEKAEDADIWFTTKNSTHSLCNSASKTADDFESSESEVDTL